MRCPAVAIERATAGIGLGPAALDEERGRDPLARQRLDSRSVTPASVGRSGCSVSIVSATRKGVRSLVDAGDDQPAGEEPLGQQERDDRDDHRHERARLDQPRVAVVDAVEPLQPEGQGLDVRVRRDVYMSGPKKSFHE